MDASAGTRRRQALRRAMAEGKIVIVTVISARMELFAGLPRTPSVEPPTA